jgi:hypothetical protein
MEEVLEALLVFHNSWYSRPRLKYGAVPFTWQRAKQPSKESGAVEFEPDQARVESWK